MRRMALAALFLLATSAPGLTREVELHAGSHVFTDDAPAYEAVVKLECPGARPARVGVNGEPERAPSTLLDVRLDGSPAGSIEVSGGAPTYWLDLRLPPGESRIELRQRPGSGAVLRSSYVGIVLTDDSGCTLSPACQELSGVSINCAGMEPFVCDLLGIEGELYCKQLVLDRIALRYQEYPNPSVDIWTPEDRAVYHRLAPQIELLTTQQRDLYARLEELSRKRPRQLKRYLDVHRKLELHYQRALGAAR